MRALVWSRFDDVFKGAGRLLDLGCGTGADALYLAAAGGGEWSLDRLIPRLRIQKIPSLPEGASLG